MNRRTYIFVLLVGILSIFSVSADGIKTRHSSLPDTIYMMGDKFYPPYEQMNEQGEPIGFTIDLIKIVMKRMNKPYVITLKTRDEMLKEAKRGKVNLYLGMTYSEERAKIVKYGTVLNYVFKCAAFRRDREHISSFSQLKDKHVIAAKGTYAHDLLTKARIKLTSVNNFKDAFSLLNRGKCDAVLCNKETVDYMIDNQKYSELDYYQLDLQPEKFCLTGNNEHLLTKINLIIYDLKKEGIYNQLVNKWFVRERQAENLRIFYISMVVVILICLLLVFFNWFLRIKVRRAMRKLENESRRLSLSVHAGNIIVWGYDVKKKVLFNIYCDYYPREGTPIELELKNYHPDDWQILGDTLEKACKGIATNVPIHVRMDRTQSGNWKYIEKEMMPVFDDKGNVIRVVGTHKDVTDDIKKQRTIDELLKQYSILFDNSTIGTSLYDKEGYLVNMNSAAVKIFGITDINKLILAKKNIFNNPHISHLIDKKNPKPSYHIIEVDYSEYQTDKYFKDYTYPQTGIHYIETHITPVFDEENNLNSIIVNNYDMTERHLLQQKVENYADKINYILKSSGIVIWDYDIHSHLVKANIFINGKIETIKIKNMLDYVDACDRNKAQSMLYRMEEASIEDFDVKLKFCRTYTKNESVFYSFHGTPVHNDKGFITAYNGLCINITDLIKTQIQLEKEKEEALKADKLKSAFLANMSHEIRTPLNSIVGFSEMMPYTEDEADRAKFYDIIKTNNELLLRLINDVLDLSRIESGNMEMIDTKFNLEDMFGDISKSYANLMPNENVILLCSTPKTDCFIRADKGRLTQVITNFINNAKKFTTEGHIKIGYSTTRNGIRMFVEDTGRGIPKEKLRSIFDRFEKVDPFMQGTGLGLSISKAIIKIYRGKIGVDSEVGKGSTFWVWLPIKFEIGEKTEVQ